MFKSKKTYTVKLDSILTSQCFEPTFALLFTVTYKGIVIF
jgi:hypothetical protein